MLWSRLCVGVLWILSLVAISTYGGVVSYGIFFAVTLLPFLSLIYLFFVYWRFRIYQEIDSRNVVCGQPIPYFFVLQNDDHFTFSGIRVVFYSSLSRVEKLPDNPEYELLPKDRFTYETRLICKYRGEYEVGVKEIVITDFLRLFRIRYSIPGKIKALVLPRVVEVAWLNSMREWNIFVQRETMTADTVPDCVVREYVPGDAVKRIHWKASARQQKLMVRNQIGEEQQGVLLWLDVRRLVKEEEQYLPVENKLLEVALALGMYFVKKNMGFVFGYGTEISRPRSVTGMKDFEMFYQSMAQMVFDEGIEATEELHRAYDEGLLSGSKLVFCVTQKWDALLDSVTGEMTKRGQFVVVYLVTADVGKDVLPRENERLRIIGVEPDAELEGCL